MALLGQAGLDALAGFTAGRHAQLDLFQLVRLVAATTAGDGAPAADARELVRRWLRIRPALTLAFPQHDLDRVERLDDGRLRVETTFFGLYGVTSPLPNYYTEDLIDAEQQGQHAQRGLFDVFHHACYALLIEAWARSRRMTGIDEGTQRSRNVRDASWLGLTERGLQQRYPAWRRMLGLAPALGQRQRSASGLQALIAPLVPSARLRVLPCVPRWAPVPAVDRLQLGQRNHRLGNATLGCRVVDRGSRVDVVAEQPSEPDVHAVLPGGERHALLRQAVERFLPSPLELRLQLHAQITPRPLGQAVLGLGAALGRERRTAHLSLRIH